jgi:hypothetical protein
MSLCQQKPANWLITPATVSAAVHENVCGPKLPLAVEMEVNTGNTYCKPRSWQTQNINYL